MVLVVVAAPVVVVVVVAWRSGVAVVKSSVVEASGVAVVAVV